MAKVQFRNKTDDELACFVGHNGWRTVKPDEVIEVDDDDVVTPGLTHYVDGKEELVLDEAGKPVRAPTSSADAYRLSSDVWAEVSAVTTAAPAPAPTAAPEEA